MKTLAFSSFKGGVGKSALAVLTGAAFAASGRRVLVVDLDHQRNLTQYHAIDWGAVRERNIAEAFHRNELEGNILPSHLDRVDFVAGSFAILKYRAIAPRTLKKLLEPVADRYDVVIVDTHPTLDTFAINAWIAADRVVTPARLDSYDLEGLEHFRATLEEEAPGKPWTVVLNFFDPPRSDQQGSLGFQYEQTFASSFPNLSRVRVPIAKPIYRAIHNGETLSSAKAKDRAYRAIVDLSSELIGEPVEPEGGSI